MNTEIIISIIIAVLFVTAIIIMWRCGLKKQAKQILLSLVVAAEQKYGGGTGEIKFSAVAAWLYEAMPNIMRYVFTTAQIAKWIEEAVCYMKKYLDDNKAAAGLIKPVS